MPYVKLSKKRGCTAACDTCKYAVGSGQTNSRHWVKYLRGDGWKTWRRPGEERKAWCSKPECQAAATDFLARDARLMKDHRNAERRERRRIDREAAKREQFAAEASVVAA